MTVSKRRESISNEFHNRRDRSFCLFVRLVAFMCRGRGGRGGRGRGGVARVLLPPGAILVKGQRGVTIVKPDATTKTGLTLGGVCVDM